MTISPISTDGFAPLAEPPDGGAAPQLRWLPIDSLFVDLAYQREMTGHSRRLVETIAHAFEWSSFAPVVVAPLEGGDFYAVIDGQHRTTAAKLVGKTSVPCSIVIAPRAAQARAFAALNSQVTRMHSLQVHKARVAAGDTKALAIERAAVEAGVKILPGPREARRQQPNETMAVAAIGSLIERYGRETAVRAMLVVTSARRTYRGMLNREALGAIAAFIDCERARDADLERFHAVNLAVVEEEARAGLALRGGRLMTHFTEVLARKLGRR